MRVVGIDPGLTGGVSILGEQGELLAVYDMPQQQRSRKRVRGAGGKMVDRISWEVDAAAFAAMIHPHSPLLDGHEVHIYIEQVGAVYRQDKQKGTDAHQPLHATFVFGEGFGVLRGICEAYYGAGRLSRVMPAVWKKHHNLLKTDKDQARILAIEIFPEHEGLLRRKKDIGRADSLLIARYGLDKQRGL